MYGYDDQLEDEIDGFDSDDQLNGLYVDNLGDRIWEDGDEWAKSSKDNRNYEKAQQENGASLAAGT